jgi:hypothetical protein
VLAPAIGVVDEPRRGPPTSQGHRERVGGQLGAQVVGRRPADHALGVGVHEDGGGESAFTRWHEGSVADPQAVRRRRREIARDQVGGGRPAGSATVVRARRQRCQPTSAAARISRATGLRAQRTPAARSSAWTVAICAVSAASAVARAETPRRAHA